MTAPLEPFQPHHPGAWQHRRRSASPEVSHRCSRCVTIRRRLYAEIVRDRPGAVINVQLQDTLRADAPAIVLGEQTIDPMGRQVPIPFSIPYNPADINPNGRYTLRARIKDADGRLRWINMQAYPVLTGGNPNSDIEVIVQPVS